MLDYLLDEREPGTVLIVPIGSNEWDDWLSRQEARDRLWFESTGFTARPGTWSLLNGPDGRLQRVIVGLSDKADPWLWAALPARLPPVRYSVEEPLQTEAADAAALGWGLGTYQFRRYKKDSKASFASLVWPESCQRESVSHTLEATRLVRDLINTPASDMGPEDLAGAARELADRYDATCVDIAGEALLQESYPAIHAVGRASARPPRLIDLRWGEKGASQITLVGKGVCFDSGGLDLKSADNMKLMKKDMGGAAQVLGLGNMIMAAGLPVRLRILIPAVENSVSGNALRPLDVVETRKGLTIEIGHTDAEGRVILADALSEASRDQPELIVDCATLTGAARIALGTGLPAMFCNNDELADALLVQSTWASDPLWRMPLFEPYRRQVESKVADLTNSPGGRFGGAITAALFLSAFVEPDIPWIHLDFMGWNLDSKPGRPEGGEAQGMRALFGLIAERWGR